MNTEPKYPEHEKLSAIRDKSQAQGEFIDWLSDEKHIYLGENFCLKDKEGDELWEFSRSHQSIRKLLAEFHGIDEDKLEREKLAMLEEMRIRNRQAEPAA
jgi:hypothetical protein